MKLPSKIFPVEESLIPFFTVILDCISRDKEKKVYELYQETIEQFSSNVDWMDTVICLYALRALNFNEEKGTLTYAL